MVNNFDSTFEYKLIYVFRINDQEHKDCLKIGDATIHTKKEYKDLFNNCHDLNYAARQRIDSYTATAGITYELLHTEVAVYKCNDKHSKKFGKILAFRDYNVHNVLIRSGIFRKYFDTNKKQNEWFKCDLQTALNAITAVKNNQKALNNNQVTQFKNPIIFRPEQESAIKKTVSRFKTHDRMLWNAKMRFGKTLTALEVAKQMKFNKTIIITHRPVVSDGWFEDFGKIFYEDNTKYQFGSKNLGKSLDNLLRLGCPFVYFASIQDLRGSETVGGNFNKNDKVFNTLWDFVVIDEAHEGTQTELGKAVIKELVKNNEKHKTRVLELSGTPFNLLSDFEADEIYTWDYIMEQEAKNNWALNHFGDSNPYEELPKLNIFTYHLEKTMPAYIDAEDKAFNFREFFRVWTGDVTKDFTNMPNGSSIGDFVHEDDVNAFLDLLCKKDKDSNYPFSTKEYQDFFRHSLWIVPGVKEAKALSKLLKQHHIFGNNEFNIVNVAGDGDEEIIAKDALQLLRDNIGDNPDGTRTITLSCGRLTTGVTVPEWTAVFMLSGTYSTAASQYLQTIFRVQSPANINGKIKENCFVFDFAPDRTLKMVAESVHLSSRAGAGNKNASIALSKFINYCPIIAIEGSSMKTFTVDQMLRELKKAYSERVARNGFDDPKIYNDELLKLTDVEIDDFNKLKKIVGSSKQTKPTNQVDINNEGYKDEEFEEIEKLKKKPKKELTEEEKQKLAELKEKKKNKDAAISILRAISIRMPLMIYGVDTEVDDDITIDKFPDLIDDLSWQEFMPKDVTKDLFRKFSKYYDKDIFIGASLRIRAISRTADELEPLERVKRITTLFSSFKNPDKETVLTPWKVVNMHLSNTIGGYDFFDVNHNYLLDEPRYVNIKNVTKKVFDDNSKILEINSKSGLYPLYVAYTLYKNKCNKLSEDLLTFDEKIKIWDEVVKNDIFVVCKTPMAKLITKRTLVGYRNAKVHTRFFEDLINQLKQEQKTETFIRKMHEGKNYWKATEDNNMKFNAIVGNPPYQLMDGGAQSSATPIYNYFVDVAKKINPDYISMIMPSRWMTAGKGLDGFRFEMIHDKKVSVLHDYFDGTECFDNVDIKGGVCYFLWDNTNNEPADIYTHYSKEEIIHSKRYMSYSNDDLFFVRDAKLAEIKVRVSENTKETFDTIVSSRKPYGITADFFKDTSKYGLPPVSNTVIDGGYRILGLGDKMKRTYKYIDKNYPLPKSEGLNELKIFIPESYGAGLIGEKITSPVIAEPGDACTETFLQIRPINNLEEAQNIVKYMNTKFFRALTSILKNTQHGTQKVYSLVPIVDFSKEWTDNDLYKEFGLTKDEIDYIENLIKD